MTDIARKRLEQEAVRLSKKYGQLTGSMGSETFESDVVPTGSLALDFALGTGGWPLRRIVHIYGEPDIGKSSILGLAAIRNAQVKGLTTGMIAVEPGFDKNWALKNGVDPGMLIVARPDDGEDAFNILYEWIKGDIVDFIVFDSIGGLVTPSEDKEEGKARVGGASGLVTSGLRRILMPTFKHEKGLILLNQIRDDLKSRFGGVKPPGGHLLDHVSDVWVHLRRSSGGAEAVRTIKDEKDQIEVGRNLTAHITRNKLSEGTGVKAKFWYNSRDTEDYGSVGIDAAQDLRSTAMRTGVIHRAGAYYRHESFPTDKQQLQGADQVDAFMAEHPEVVEEIRHEVLAVMRDRRTLREPGAPDLDAFDQAMKVVLP